MTNDDNPICKKCEMKFEPFQIEKAYGKEQLDNEREQLALQVAEQEDQNQRLLWKREAEEKKFDCEICFGDLNINSSCRTLNNCMHRFCEECLKDHVLTSYMEGEVECPLCKDIPVEERKFPDPTIQEGEIHDPNKIQIAIQIIQDILSKQDFEKLQERWNNILFLKGFNSNEQSVEKAALCPGFKKRKQQLQKDGEDQQAIKVQNQDLDQLQPEEEEQKQQYQDQNEEDNELVEKEVFVKKLSYGINAIGFDIKQCEAMYIYENVKEKNEDGTLKPIKIDCKTCKLSFCPDCLDVAHDQSCDDYKKFIQEEIRKNNLNEQQQQDQAYIDQLIQNEPKKFKKCPNCQSLIEKNGGCNRVNCAFLTCKKSICWVCSQFFDNDDGCYKHLRKEHGGYF